LSPDTKLQTTQRWVESFVVGKRLCPFAAPELQHNRLRYALSEAATPQSLLEDLGVELQRLLGDDSISTTLLVHPNVLHDFMAYNQFLDSADALLEALNLDGVYQIASFHPDYQFAETAPEDAENYTNRSPYPMLHLLPEAKVSEALATVAAVDEISSRNVALLQATGSTRLAQQWRACFEDS
jgi:hypothetical protein